MSLTPQGLLCRELFSGSGSTLGQRLRRRRSTAWASSVMVLRPPSRAGLVLLVRVVRNSEGGTRWAFPLADVPDCGGQACAPLPCALVIFNSSTISSYRGLFMKLPTDTCCALG